MSRRQGHSLFNLRTGRGFTLMEMLVVISILTLLISMILPSLNAAKEDARASKCANHTRQWAVGFHGYITDHNSNMPDFADQYPGLAVETLWYNTTGPYLGLARLSAGDPHKSKKNSRNWHAAVRTCPTGGAFVGVHYGAWNDTRPATAPINYATRATADPPVTYPRLKLEHVRHADTWFMLFDTATHFMYSPNRWLRTVDTDEDGVADTHVVLSGDPTYRYNGARPRQHRDSFNAAFCDTHVERIGYAVWLDIDNGLWRDE